MDWLWSCDLMKWGKVAGVACLRRKMRNLVLNMANRCASLVAQSVKNLPAMQETWVGSLGQEDPLEKERATHFSILAWEIPWTKEPGRLQSMGLKSWTWLSVKPPPMANRCQLDEWVVKREIWINTVGEWVGRAGDWDCKSQHDGSLWRWRSCDGNGRQGGFLGWLCIRMFSLTPSAV